MGGASVLRDPRHLGDLEMRKQNKQENKQEAPPTCWRRGEIVGQFWEGGYDFLAVEVNRKGFWPPSPLTLNVSLLPFWPSGLCLCKPCHALSPLLATWLSPRLTHLPAAITFLVGSTRSNFGEKGFISACSPRDAVLQGRGGLLASSWPHGILWKQEDACWCSVDCQSEPQPWNGAAHSGRVFLP